MRAIRRHLTFANVASGLALLIALGGGTADAANTVFSADIVNGEVKSADIGDGEVRAAEVAPDSLGGAKIADRSVKNADLATGASSSNTIADGGIEGIDVKNDTLKGADVDEPSLEIVNDTVFRTDSVVNQPNGQRRTIVTATGLAPGAYLISYRMYMTNPQRYECGVMSGESYLAIPRYVITEASPETLQDTFVGTLSPGQEPRLVCNGFTEDWSVSNVELHFIEIGEIANGVEG